MANSLEFVASQLEYLIDNPLAILCEIAHYTIVIGGVKKSWGQHVSTQSLATYFTSLVCCFGGGTLVNLFCGKPPLASLLKTQSVVFASIIWWLVFYSPKNVFSKLAKWQPLAITLMLLKEMIRTRKIIKGVAIARSVYPSSLLICTLMGMLSACGGGFIKHNALMASQTWGKDSIKNYYFSTLTKSCLIFSLLYNLQIDGVFPFSAKAVALLQVTFLYAISVSSHFGQSLDIFYPVEKVASSILIDYSAFTSAEKSDEASSGKAKPKQKQKSKSHRKED